MTAPVPSGMAATIFCAIATSAGSGEKTRLAIGTWLGCKVQAPAQPIRKLLRNCTSHAAAGIKPFYGPFGDIADTTACEVQFRNSFLMGCAGAWTLHPNQVPIAKRVFSPDPAEVAFAQKIVAAMPDGSGAVMIDGKMQDDATWKQAKVLVDLARLVAAKDPAMAAQYRL